MRHLGIQVAAGLALLVGGACASKGMRAEYPPRDRHAMAVLFPSGNACSVIGGPESHIAFPGKKVVWRVVNLCSEDVDLEIVLLGRNPDRAPANPFTEDPGRAALRAARGTAASNTFQLTIRDSGFAAGVENQYKYRLRIKGRPDSGIDPELDIWP